jgi:hypothetical protein
LFIPVDDKQPEEIKEVKDDDSVSFEDISIDGSHSAGKNKSSDFLAKVKKMSEKNEEIKDIELTNELFTVLSFDEVKGKTRKSKF